jgi:hypothetical protein
VTTDLDTRATALYVRADDLLKESPQLGPWRPAAGISPRLSDAELVTLAVMQALLGFTSEARWLRHARAACPSPSPWPAPGPTSARYWPASSTTARTCSPPGPARP